MDNLDKAGSLAKVRALPGMWLTFKRNDLTIKLSVNKRSNRVVTEVVPLGLRRSFRGKDFNEVASWLVAEGWTITDRRDW